MHRNLRLIVLAALAALTLAACGGSSKSPRAELVAKADPICKQVSVRRKAANEALSKAGGTSPKGLQLLARLAPGVAAYELQAVDRLQTLKAPSSLEQEWQHLLAGMHQLAEDAAQIGTQAKANKLKKVESITSSARALRQQLATIASRDGFTYCGTTS
jgi:ABC-type enterochelin transport system substrate-binding protein